jgi:hypothetical protein
MAPDRDLDISPATMRDDIAGRAPPEERPQATSAAVEAASAEAEPREFVPARPRVSDGDPVLPDFTAAIELTRAPAPIITARNPGRLGFAADTITVSESAGAVPLRVVRRGGAAGTVSFNWRAIGDSAVADMDYAAMGTGSESIGAGETSKTFLIPIVSDAIAESTEFFDIVIEDPTAGATLDAITQITVIVVDDD